LAAGAPVDVVIVRCFVSMGVGAGAERCTAAAAAIANTAAGSFNIRSL
jgi:hypothetical protein